MAATTQHATEPADPIAGVLAFLLPGLGHVYRGERLRGMYAAVGVLGLIAAGTLIGGVDVVDRREDKWWFVGQAFAGPIVFGLDWYNQTMLKAWGPAPAREPVYADERYFVLRSGWPNERRDVANGRPVWRPATDAELAAGKGPPATKSLAKVNEIGTLYVLCGGMVNSIIILDALLPVRPRVRRNS